MPYANNNGVKIYYEVEGQGPPLVMLHGGGKDHTSWREFGFTEALKENYYLLLIDERGAGKSDKPQESTLYDIEYRVGDVTAVLDDLNVNGAHFLGYSYGGRISLECAKLVPDRVLSIAIGGMGPQGKSYDGSNKVLKLLEANPEMFLQNQVSAEEKTRYMKTVYPASIALLKSPWPNLEADLPSMNMPFLIFLGENDILWPPIVTNKAYSILPNATFVILPGFDHVQAGTRSDIVLPHIKKFLAQVSKK